MHKPWHLGRLAAFDFEASDKECKTARAVSCALVLVGDNQPTETRTWLINPGIAQEPGAIAIHKLTDEHLAANGMPAKQAIQEIAEAVAAVVREGIPLVGHNLGSFDLNLLNHETLRHLGAALEEFTGRIRRVIDTMVLDRHAAPYRRRVSEKQGPYQMRTTAETYGLACDIDELHRRQARWAADQAASYQEWLRSEKAGEKRDTDAVIDGSWPLAPFPAAVTS